MGIDSIGSPGAVVVPKPQTEVAAPAPEAAKPAAAVGFAAASTFSASNVGATDAERRAMSPAELSKDNYAKFGNQPVDITNKQGAESLVVMSPQLDNLDSTGNDKVRCGGACLADAVLLDGDPKGNAAALQKLKTQCEANGATYPKEQVDALNALGKGKMTPVQAAHLQEFMMTTAQFLPARPAGATNVDGGGITPNGMAATLQAINQAGGLRHGGNVEMTSEVRTNDKGGTYNHWTLTTRDASLSPTHVDPMPNQYGNKTLEHAEPPPAPSFVTDPADPKREVPNPKLQAQVVLYPKHEGDKGSIVDVRTRGFDKQLVTNGPVRHVIGHVRYEFDPAKKAEPKVTAVMRDKDTMEELGPLG
ncbi:MAG: hypothetical protein U0228_34675 [Myxococcaceae bacterium]